MKRSYLGHCSGLCHLMSYYSYYLLYQIYRFSWLCSFYPSDCRHQSRHHRLAHCRNAWSDGRRTPRRRSRWPQRIRIRSSSGERCICTRRIKLHRILIEWEDIEDYPDGITWVICTKRDSRNSFKREQFWLEYVYICFIFMFVRLHSLTIRKSSQQIRLCVLMITACQLSGSDVLSVVPTATCRCHRTCNFLESRYTSYSKGDTIYPEHIHRSVDKGWRLEFHRISGSHIL